MRPFVAVTLFALAVFPGIAFAKKKPKKPPKIIPALANARVIGVYCEKSSQCGAIVQDVRNHLGERFRILELVKTLEPDGKITFPGLDQCDLEIDVEASMDYGSYFDAYDGDLTPRDTETLTAMIFDHRTGKVIQRVVGSRSQFSDLAEVYGIDAPDEEIWKFVLLHSGMAAEACGEPVPYLRQSKELFSSGGPVQGDDLEAVERFEKFCEKNGLGH